MTLSWQKITYFDKPVVQVEHIRPGQEQGLRADPTPVARDTRQQSVKQLTADLINRVEDKFVLSFGR